MANQNPNHPKEFTIPNGDAPSSTIIVVDSSSIGRSNTTKLVLELIQQLATLQ
jgi:hypothetical protein